MTLLDILVIAILVLSFGTGLREGAVKHFFSLASLVIAVWITGVAYHIAAGVVSFLPGSDWENVAGFLITLAITSVLLSLLLLPPRKVMEAVWKGGCLFRLLGGLLNVVSASIGLAVFTLVLQAYPIFDWLARAAAESGVITWLVVRLDVLRVLLPAEFWGAAGSSVAALARLC